MTTRHLVNGLMRYMRARTHRECEVKLGLPLSTFCRLYHGNRKLSLKILDRVQLGSGLSFDQLMAWFRQADTAVVQQPIQERTP